MPSRRTFLKIAGQAAIVGCALGPIPAYAAAPVQRTSGAGLVPPKPPPGVRALYVDARAGGDLNTGTHTKGALQTIRHLRDVLDHGMQDSPVALSGFSVSPWPRRSIHLEWTVSHERPHAGFQVLLREQGRGDFQRVALVPGNSLPSSTPESLKPHTYVHAMHEWPLGWYEVALAVAEDSTVRYSSVLPVRLHDARVGSPSGQATDADDPLPSGLVYRLSPALPNPATIRAQMSLYVASTQRVRATVYDLRGRRIATLFDDTVMAQREYKLIFDTYRCASGVYLCYVSGEAFSASRRIVVIR